ncbi:hypothetical protein Godav_000274, partial [Gossypium davidsonii]|nr:hypothetical protein [Gossypium davidsonii]
MVEGLFIAWGKRFRRIEVKCDNALFVELLLAGGDGNSSLVELRLLHQLLCGRWDVTREHNGVADHMIKCA